MLAAVLALVVLASPMLPSSVLLDENASADSVASWTRVFHLHDGAVLVTDSYDWMNSSGPYNPPYSDYDGDGLMGITIKKWNPSEHWRHFWTLHPPVNSPVRIAGDLNAYVWAKSRDNVSGVMTVTFSDVAPGTLGDPDSWTQICSSSVSLTGPVYSDWKLYEVLNTGLDYTLPEGHIMAMSAFRGDSVNDGLMIMYDQNLFDSYVVLDTTTFLSVDSVWTQDSLGVPRAVFSDGETIELFANMSNPFGSYEIVGATADVRYVSNGSMARTGVSMTLLAVDPAADSSWAVFTTSIIGLVNSTYGVTVYGYDPQGAPSWLNCTVTVVTVDHFGVDVPASATVGDLFSLTVSALDPSNNLITNWVGTVTLDAFLEDMVTPGIGSLAVTSVVFDLSDNGQVTIEDQTYDYAEETIVILASSNSHLGWSAPFDIRAGPVVSVTISPASSELYSGWTEDFTAQGTDSLGNTNTSWTPVWSLEGVSGSVTGAGLTVTFLATETGSGTIKCENPETGASDSSDITVIAGALTRIEIVPGGPLIIREGESQVFTVYGYDSSDNLVSLSNPLWMTNTTGSISGVGATVTYTAGYIPETGVIEARVGTISDVVDLTVINALDGPWLSTIPMQISSEDSNWTLSLATYWHHADGTDGLMWYVENVNSSLYLIISDPYSEATLKFVTQPDKFGDDVFRLWVRDSDGYSTYQDVSVSIQPVNDRPEFVHDYPLELYVKFDTPYTFDYNYYTMDVDTPKEDLWMFSSLEENILFDWLVGTFLFPEKSGSEEYFEIVTVTLTDAAEGIPVDGTNSDVLNVMVRVTDDTPPSLNQPLPDVTLYEGEMDHFAFDLDDYFYDLDNDYLVYSRDFENIVIDIDQITHWVNISAPTEWSGTTDGTFTATDPIGALKTDTIAVTVIAVNDAPRIVDDPWAIHVRYDVPTYLDVSLFVYDPDHALQELDFVFSAPNVTCVDQQMVILFGPQETIPYTAMVDLAVTDPLNASDNETFRIIVSDNYAPTVASPIPYYSLFSFLEDTYLNNSLDLSRLFVDADDEGFTYIVTGNTEVNITIYPDGVVNFSASENWFGNEVVVFSVFDSHAAWASWQATIVVIPVNDAPVILPIPDKIVRGGPRTMNYDIGGYFRDIETPFEYLAITVETSTNVVMVGGLLYISLPDGIDVITLTVYCTDEDGIQSNVVTFQVGVSKTIAELIGYPYSFPLVLLVAGVASYFLASRIPRPYALENVFLIHNDGRLMAHVTEQENTNIDKDVVSAMFTAVQEFVRDSFQQGEVGLKKLEIGDKNVVIEKGQFAYLALIYSGWPTKEVFESLAMLLRDVEERYKGRIEKWNGTSKTIKGIDRMLQSFMANTFRPGTWQLEEEEGLREKEWVDILNKES